MKTYPNYLTLTLILTLVKGMVEKKSVVSGNLKNGVLISTAAGAHGNTSFEMLKLNHIPVSKFIIVIMLNIETVENAMPERREMYFYV